MKTRNFVWTRDPSEAYSNPYEYEAQEQFARESYKVLTGFKLKLELYNGTFQRDDRSLNKAVWMLLTDATDSLLECHDFLMKKNHKIAGRIFRDAIEVIDLANLFSANSDKSKNLLNKWYDDNIIPNREYRDYVNKEFGSSLAEDFRNFYSQISKFNHRTYRTLSYGYILNQNKALVYDGFSSHLNDNAFLVFPGIISMYYALLAHLISILSISLEKCILISKFDIEEIWKDSIEEFSEQRIYKSIEDIIKNRDK